MGLSAEELKQELEATAEEVLGRLKSRQLFQSEWDIAAFAVFLTFVGECGSRSKALPWCWGRGHIWMPLCLVSRHCGVAAVAGCCPLLLLLLLQHLPQAPEGEPLEGEPWKGWVLLREERSRRSLPHTCTGASRVEPPGEGSGRAFECCLCGPSVSLAGKAQGRG